MQDSLQITVPEIHRGCRLDRFLPEALVHQGGPKLSRARLQALIAEGAVKVLGHRCRPAQKLRAGDAISVQLPQPTSTTLLPQPMNLRIVYEDAHLLVVDKPAHLVVHPGAGRHLATLVHGLLAHCQDLSGIGGVLRPGIVHRLDAGTTGLMVVAKDDRSHLALQSQFQARTIQKGYVALVWRPHVGQPLGQSGCRVLAGVIDTPYGRSTTCRRRMTGKLPEAACRRRARTRWRLVAENHEVALMEVRLLTGRTHQIRVHLSEMGWPIVADELYGVRGSKLPRLAPRLDHQALHAAYLAFDHPITAQRLQLRAPLPDTWAELAHALPKVGGG